MIETIIFDFDGVIVDSVDIKTQAFAKLFEHEETEIKNRIVDYHLNNTGVSRYEKFKYIYKEILHRPLSEEQFQASCQKFAKLVVDEVVKAPYIKGASDFFKKYYLKYKFFVISATPQKEIEEIIQKRNITHFFDAIYGAPINKSDAVKDILKKINTEPINVLYVGDSMSDYKAARDNAMKFVALTDGNTTIFSNIDCLKIIDFIDLIAIIDTL